MKKFGREDGHGNEERISGRNWVGNENRTGIGSRMLELVSDVSWRWVHGEGCQCEIPGIQQGWRLKFELYVGSGLELRLWSHPVFGSNLSLAYDLEFRV